MQRPHFVFILRKNRYPSFPASLTRQCILSASWKMVPVGLSRSKRAMPAQSYSEVPLNTRENMLRAERAAKKRDDRIRLGSLSSRFSVCAYSALSS